MSSSFTFEIMTPQRTVYSGKVSSLVVPATEGSFGVLANHAALVADSNGGKLKIREENVQNEKFFKVGPGVFEVFKNRAVLLTKSADPV